MAAEADWPDAYRVNRHVRGLGERQDADEALSGFERFPAWMWRNVVVRDFVEWLRIATVGASPNGQRQAGSLPTWISTAGPWSMHEVIAYLDKIDPRAAARARARYACFDHASADDGQAYGFSAAFGAGPSCEKSSHRPAGRIPARCIGLCLQGRTARRGRAFYAQRNAQTVRNAEEYYRAMFGGRVTSWNLRDQHMAQTLEALLQHLDRHHAVPSARIVVRAHNSHVGDARATEVWADGQLTSANLSASGTVTSRV